MIIRPRSFSFALITVLLVLVAGWVGGNTWRELQQLHRSFASVQADDLYLPSHVEATVRELNDTVLRIDLRQDHADRAAFEEVSQELQRWIRAQRDALTTPEQRDLMIQIETAFEVYLTRSARLMDGGIDTSPPTPVLEQVENNAAPVLDLCGKLKESERTEQTRFFNDSQRALAWIQRLLTVIFVVLVGLAGTGIVAIYTGVIGPLRVELTQSRALAIRNEKLASLGTLAAGVAHEIRNPLTAINVRLHSLKRGLAKNSSEQEDALVIDHEIQRLEHIVQEFLQFARPAEPKLVVVSADSLLARVQSLFGSQLEKASIRLNLESVPDIWVRADPHQIEQVLINLIRNAAESIEHDGTITLRVRTDTARLTGRARPVVVLEVSDTGKGIPPEARKRMFDPFFSTKEEGTGLGLVIASRIIEKHDGALEFRSEVNRGTTFTILLPQTKPEDQTDESAT
ncbi:MAG TPA: ATP-binding protein [Verrucomicrobiae bacterium]|nr:ATP-binding protein [Verrucomicrobiae bacterium]